MPGYGEKPGAGTYVCPHDGQRVVLQSDDDMLMECPSCEGMEFVRVSEAPREMDEARPRLLAVLGYKEPSARADGEELELDAVNE
jgi:hypothetical protein